MGRIWGRWTGRWVADVPLVLGLAVLTVAANRLNAGPVGCRHVVCLIGPLLHPAAGTATGAWPAAPQLLALLALFGRRRWPLATLTFIVAVGALVIVANGAIGPTALPVMVALYALALVAPRRVWVIAAIATAVVVITVSIAYGDIAWPRAFSAVVWLALPPAIAEAIRNRRALLRALEERARAAEETRDEEARRRVAEERIRIAGDLHDVLAHSIAVINVQSGVAAYVIDRDPGQARDALGHINDASDTALRELRATIDLLRQDGEPAAPTDPAPGLGRLDELVDAVRATGIEVRSRTSGALDRVPPETGLTAYRVVQEALTNVLKHAGAHRVDVRVELSDGTLTVDVHDDGAGAAAAQTDGHGRAGMRERVRALGGTLRDGPADAGYRVTAALPVREDLAVREDRAAREDG